MKSKFFCISLLALVSLSPQVFAFKQVPMELSKQVADWRVYQSGSGLELSIDAKNIYRQNGLIYFVNQEYFINTVKYDKPLNIKYSIRQTDGIANCKTYEFSFINASFYDLAGKHVYSQMFPLQQYNRVWNKVYADSLADAMMQIVCRLGLNAPTK